MSRKFILAVLATVIASGLVYLKCIEGQSYCTLVGTVVIAYLSANVAQKATIKE
jgi:hypothetical protein